MFCLFVFIQWYQLNREGSGLKCLFFLVESHLRIQEDKAIGLVMLIKDLNTWSADLAPPCGVNGCSHKDSNDSI